MKQKLLNASAHSWLWFLLVLLVSLFFGLVLRDSGNEGDSGGHGGELHKSPPALSNPLPIRKTRSQEGIYRQAASQNTEASVDDMLIDDSSLEVKREAVLMGSQFVFIVDAPKQQALAAIAQAAEAIKKLEANLSSWKPNSDVSRLNERAGRGSVSVADDTFELLLVAKELSEKTQGTFDVTVGAVWDIWPFRNRHLEIPSQSDIDQHLRLVDAQSIELDVENRTAYLPQKGMKVNLGAIGKGFAAGLAIKKMKSLGIERAAVSAGGDIYLLGEKNSGPWVVELEHPRWPGRFLDRFVAADIAVATSGDAKQYLEKGGKRYSHILDPRTGWPVDDCQSVTIVTQSSTQADAFATAVYVMGPVDGMHWVEQRSDLEALIVDKEGRIHRSSGWKALTNKHKTLSAISNSSSRTTKTSDGTNAEIIKY